MTLYDSMVESYAPKTAAERFAVQQEVMQLIALPWYASTYQCVRTISANFSAVRESGSSDETW